MEKMDELLQSVQSTTVSNVEVLVREVRVNVGVLTRRVTIRIYQVARGTPPYRFELSAVMNTSRGRDAGDLDRTAVSEAEALKRAIRMLSQEYEEAVRNGEMPDDAWLVESDRF